MHERKHNHGQHIAVDGQHVHYDTFPYWKRAHQDWRFWIGMLLMVVAITVYVMSDDLSLVLHSQPRRPASTAVRK